MNDVGKAWRDVNLPAPKEIEASPGKTTPVKIFSPGKQKKPSTDGDGTPIGKKQCIAQAGSVKLRIYESDASSDEEEPG